MKESWVFSLVAVILAITALICSLCANSNHAATYEDNDIGKVTIGLWKMCNGELGCYDIHMTVPGRIRTLAPQPAINLLLQSPDFTLLLLYLKQIETDSTNKNDENRYFLHQKPTTQTKTTFMGLMRDSSKK
ncbi:uncharacterized protein LOC142342212 isoform X2 [Convolutriloba macropyga]|uniref:uncharacterized protein LOC142342212 isoform X2 n=1 Tax=Convolutriloba macropyga TaxID=536237 RepID=UPI003F5254AC